MKGKNYKKKYFHSNVKYIQPKYNWAQGVIADTCCDELEGVVFDYYRHFKHCYYADMLGLPEPNKENYMYVADKEYNGIESPIKTSLTLDNILDNFDRLFGMEDVE